MNRNVALMMLGLMIAVPLAAAQEAIDPTNDTHPNGKPSVCGAEVDCAGGVKPATSDNCMDGQQANETCDPNVYYVGGPVVAGAPQNASSNDTAASNAATPAKAVPAAGIVVVVAAAGVALVAARRR